MPRQNPRTGLSPAQLDIFSPLRHIELAIEREARLLSKYERSLVRELLHSARRQIQDASEILAHVQSNRLKRNAKCPNRTTKK